MTSDPATARLAAVATVDEQHFRVMGSDAHVIVVGGADGLAEMARARLEYLEGRWSRFRDDSELSLANAHPGRWTEVSPETVDLVERALVAHEHTDGLFDPTRLHDVVAAGYRVSFDELAAADVVAVGTSARTGPHGPVEIDRPGLRMRVPAGCGFDPGGIGKGVAADLVSAELMAEGADGVCVNVGGDLRVRGIGPDGGDWVVGIDDPRDPVAPPLARLHLSDGAVATSSRLRRRWTRADGTEAHHLIDPRTGEPARTDVLTATVVAAEGWQAEALAKTAFLSSLDAFLARLADAGATGLVVTASGAVPAPGFDAFTL